MSRLVETLIEYPSFKETSDFTDKEIIIAGDLGPCGGVGMAILGMDIILSKVKNRETVYANNEPVHNKLIVEEFVNRGLVIEPNIDKIPNGAIWVSSAHGLNQEQFAKAKDKECQIVNLECQLVTKVKRAAIKAQNTGEQLVYLGISGHPETNAILSMVAKDNLTFIDKGSDPKHIIIPNKPLKVLNQTTLSTKSVADNINKLRVLNPDITIPEPIGICPATDNRQTSVYSLFSDEKKVDFLLVIGSKNSHNSQELRNIGISFLDESFTRMVDTVLDIDPDWFSGNIKRIGLTAGASVLDKYTEDVLRYFQKGGAKLTFMIGKDKKQIFRLPEKDLDELDNYLDNKYKNEN